MSGEGGNATITADDTVVNDAVDPLWDYRSSPAATPVGASQDAFFIYDKDHTSGGAADKIVSGVNLSTDAGYAADVAAAFTAIGGATIDQLSQFDFFKASFNKKYGDQNASEKAAGATLIDASDNAQPWAVKQITYPELIHLLNIKDSVKDFVILFGGTWCPNTQAVIESVNRYAQANNVTVYNFDTVLDGGDTNSGTTSATDPLQIRNTANNGTTPNANPTYLYANVLTTFLKNIVTEYDLNNSTFVTYYPNGNTSSTLSAVRKLQVPFLIDYQRGTGSSASSTAIHGQWIKQKLDANTGLPSYTEYMTTLTYTHPETGTGRLGLSNAQLPTAIPTIPGVAGFDWKNPVYPDPTTFADASQYLTAAESTASDRRSGGGPGQRPVPVGRRRERGEDGRAGRGVARCDPDRQPDHHRRAPGARWPPARAASPRGWRATSSGRRPSASSRTFFGGLPGGVVSTQTVTAPAVTAADTPSLTVAIANDYGRVPTGNVTLAVAGSTYTQPVAANAASFTLPKLAAGSYAYTLNYAGDDQILPFSKTGTLLVAAPASGGGGGGGGSTTVTPTATSTGGTATAPLTPPAINTGKYKVTVSTVKPTTTTAGKYKVTVVTPSGSAGATGKVTVKLEHGSTAKTLTGALAHGTTTIVVPKLPAGVWSRRDRVPGRCELRLRLHVRLAGREQGEGQQGQRRVHGEAAHDEGRHVQGHDRHAVRPRQGHRPGHRQGDERLDHQDARGLALERLARRPGAPAREGHLVDRDQVAGRRELPGRIGQGLTRREQVAGATFPASATRSGGAVRQRTAPRLASPGRLGTTNSTRTSDRKGTA